MGRHVNSAGAGGGEKRISGGIILQKKSTRLGLVSCLDTTRSLARSVTVDVSAHGRRLLTCPAAPTARLVSSSPSGGDADSSGS